MIEYWDIYDENRNKTGRIYRRGDEMQSGDYHLVIHVCIFNSKNELLIQRRHPDKIGWPGIWDISAASYRLSLAIYGVMAALRQPQQPYSESLPSSYLSPPCDRYKLRSSCLKLIHRAAEKLSSRPGHHLLLWFGLLFFISAQNPETL